MAAEPANSYGSRMQILLFHLSFPKPAGFEIYEVVGIAIVTTWLLFRAINLTSGIKKVLILFLLGSPQVCCKRM